MTTFVNDTFTGADGTSLTTHVGETGATWTRHAAYTSATAPVLGNNRVRDGAVASGRIYWASGVPSSADYDVQADLYVASLLSEAEQAGIYARVDTTSAHAYAFNYLTSTASWRITRTDSTSSSATLGTYAQTLTVGQTYTMKLRVQGSTITGYVNGVSVISVTDTTYSGAGRAGLTLNMPTTTPSNSVGLHLDNFLAGDIVTLPPSNTAAPSIIGTAQEGQTVNCTTGTWTNSPTSYSYQWRRDGSAISGSTTSSYVLASADVGHLITCTVTATNAAGSTSAESNGITPTAAVSPPVNTVAPAITGTAQVGQILSVSDGTWTNSPTGYLYQWKRAGVAISGATSSTYVVTSGDVGQAVKCTVTAVNAGGSTSADSNTVTPTAVPAPSNTVAPQIYGSALSGQTLNCTTGSWNNSPTAFTYQWERAGVAISGAVNSSYTVADVDINSAVTCEVTATNDSGSATTASNAITILPSPAPGVLSLPFITGTAQTNAVLFASNGTWSGNPAAFAYQWKRNGVAISGATENQYILTVTDEGTAITCSVTASNGSLSTSATSEPVVPVPVDSVGDVAFWTQGIASGLAGVVGLQVLDAVTGDILVARSTENIEELPAGSGVYRALRVTEPPVGSILIWDDGSTTPGHVAVTRY